MARKFVQLSVTNIKILKIENKKLCNYHMMNFYWTFYFSQQEIKNDEKFFHLAMTWCRLQDVRLMRGQPEVFLSGNLSRRFYKHRGGLESVNRRNLD